MTHYIPQYYMDRYYNVIIVIWSSRASTRADSYFCFGVQFVLFRTPMFVSGIIGRRGVPARGRSNDNKNNNTNNGVIIT